MNYCRLASILMSISLLLFLGTACKKYEDLEDAKTSNWKAEFAIPLFSSSTSLEDVLQRFEDGTFVTVNAEGLIVLNYKGDIIARSTEDIFNVLSDGFFEVEDTSVAIYLPLPSSMDLDFADLKSGTIAYRFESRIEEELDVKITYPQLIKNGTAFQIATTVPPGNTNVPYVAEGGKSVIDYRLISTNNDSLLVEYEARRVSNGELVELKNFFMAFVDFKFSYLEGYLGQDLYELDRDTLEIEFFENWTRGDVYFEDPKILLTIRNSFGFPVRTSTQVMNVFTADGTTLNITSPFITDGVDVSYPKLNQVGLTTIDSIYMDNTNSNLQAVLSSNPIALDYDIDAVPNPDQNLNIRGFSTDSSEFRVRVEVELPIYGTASGFAVTDTFEVDFSTYDKVDFVEFKIISENGIPLEVMAQIYFVNEANEILDSLFQFEERVLEAAPVDGNGEATSKMEKVSFAKMDAARFNNIRKANRILVASAFETYNDGQQLVKIYADQVVELRMGMRVGLSQ